MISCARISKTALEALTKRYHVSENTLKTIIHKYWMENGTEEFFPSEVYVNAQLGNGQYKEDIETVRQVWEKSYKKPLEIKAEELKAAKEEALKYFPDSAVNAYENDKGTYTIVVKEPVAKTTNSIKNLLSKDSYSKQEYADYKLAMGVAADETPVNKGPQEFTFKDGTKIQAPFQLNYQQEEALNAMDEFVKSDATSMTLSGYAGTGKTSLMEMLAKKMRQSGKNIVFSASTNKAAAVLRERVKKAGFTAQTLNKVFGITVEVDETKPYDASNLVVKLRDANIRQGTVVVIDEASMINTENYNILNGIAKEFGLKIIYVGDEAQLAPVNETKISKVFRDSAGDVKRLTIVERTEDNAILKEATAIRNGEALSGESSFNKEGKGVAYLKPTNRDAMRAIIDRFVPQLKEKPDFFRILAYTNNAVARYNDAVRNKLGYTDNTPRVGEPIVGYSNWGYLFGKGSDASYRFINSESYTVTKVGKTDTTYITLEDGTRVPMQATEVTIADAMGNKDTVKLMDIRHNEANKQNAQILAKEKARYWSLARNSSGKIAADYRKKANQIDEFLFVNDVVTDPTRKDKNGRPIKLQNKVFDFGYAMTAHKSQGSTFTHVLIDDVDIQTAKNRRASSFGDMVPLEDTMDTSTQDVSPNMIGTTTDDFDLEDTSFPGLKTSNNESTNIRQQLEYVAVSRATDTVTIISNNVKKEDSPLNHIKENSQDSNTINQQESRSNKTANLISATIAPYFNTSYEDYVAMTSEEQKDMREAFAKAAKEVAKALGITLNMKEASFNIGGYEFDDGGSVVEPSFTFRLDTTPENARLFAALMGDLGYEQQEAVVSNYDIEDRDSADGIRFSLEFKDSATLLKLINQFDIKNFTYDKTNGVLSVLSFDAADVEKFHKLVQQLKENGYDKESETFYFKSSYDGRTGRKTLYGKWLKAQEGNSQGVQSELYSLVQEALKRVNYYSGKPSNYEGLIEPDEDTIFVFGSNPKGIHGAGAAATAKAKFGAIQGQGEGMQGNTYALPTKDLDKAKGTRWYKPSKKEEAEVKEWYKTHDYSEVQNHPLNAERTMTPQQIIESIKRLYEVANQNPDKQFKVSHYPFGQLSLNGYLGEEMLAMFKQAGQIPSNIIFNKEWTDHWNEIQPAQPAQQAQQQALQQTKTLTINEIYNQLKAQYAPNSSEAKLTDIVFQALRNTGVELKAADLGDGVSGRFVASENAILFNPNALQSNTLLHEAIHAVTSYYLEAENTQGFSKEIKVAIQEIEECYNLLKQDFIEEWKKKDVEINDSNFGFWIEDNDTYGLTDPKEMIAELGKPEFIEHIKSFDRRHKGKNIFQRLKNAIFTLFGINKSYGNLESTLKNALVTLLTNPSNELMQRYSQENTNVKKNYETLRNSNHITVKNGRAITEMLNTLSKDASEEYGDTVLIMDEDLISDSFVQPKTAHVERLSHLKNRSILIYENMLFMSLNGTPKLENGKAIIPIRVYSKKGLTLNKFDIQRNSDGIDYIKTTTPLFPEAQPIILQPTQQPQQQVVGENISSRGSEFAKRLTNPFNNETVEFRGTKFDNAEHAYQTWKSGKFDQRGYDAHGGKIRGTTDYSSNYQTMVEILTAKLQQHPDLVKGITERGGEAYLKASTHDVIGDKYWETKTGQNKFIEALTEAYNSVASQQAVMSEGESSGITVQLPGYEYFNDLYEDTTVDAEWKVPMLQELDAQLSTENTQEQNDAILAQMDRILEATSEEDLYGSLTQKQAKVIEQKLGSIGELNQKINTLYESNLLPASEVLHVAELIMNSISDDVTRLQREPGLAKQWFPSLTTELDFQNATRKEIIEAVGINRLIQAAKKNFDSSEHEYDDVNTELQADLITENWDAIVSFGTKIFSMNEGFGIKMDYRNGGYVLADGMKLGFDDLNDQQDIDSIREQVGDEQEHWQIEQRTLDILNNASEIVRMAIHECYKIGKDGKPIISKWGIKERMNPREAINSILTWTQGALSLDDMVSKLMEKQIQNPWLSQLIDKLKVVEGQENPNADFQSQFFNTMCRSFQSYSIVLLENGKYAAVPVNDHPSLTEIMQSITSQFNIKEHPLFRSESGKEEINTKYLGSEATKLSDEFNLHKAKYELDKITQSLEEGKELSAEMLENAKDNISGALKILGYTPADDVLDNVLNADTIQSMARYIGYIVNSLDKALEDQKKGKEYNPFGFKSKNGIAGTLRNLLEPITNALDATIPNVVYDDGKLYQAYVTPSYLTLLFEKFHWEEAKFKEFIEKEYGYSEWFKYANSGDEGWRGGWLKMLATDQASRDLFAHTVELNFNKRRYMRNMTDAEYTMSLFAHYFAEEAEGEDAMVPAWFRVPIQSNKPSSEFIRFWSYRGDSYKTNIVDGMYEMFLQEVNRIQTVRMRNLDKTRPGFIKSFDENGRKFSFLPYLNDYFSDGKKENRTLLKEKDGVSAAERNNKLAEAIQSIENLKELKEDDNLRALVSEAIENFMQQRADEILQDYEKQGLIEAAKSIKDICPETIKGKEEQTAWVREQLENYIWNDHYATNNILQLTIGDKAACKDADEMQKRLAELHAPGIRANIKATDYEGNRVSDGTYRTIILKDFEMLKSNIIENLTEYFDREIEKASAEEKESWKAIKEDLVGENGRFRKINVVDGQGYSSPSSYRKKAFMFGRWSKQAEKIYQNLKEGNATMEDVKTAFQPLKPFVYSQLHKEMGVANAPITKMPIPFQAKNSEYLLIMADALLQGQNTGRPNMLRAIYRVMEDSELLNPTKGIDTVQFESAIKSGLQGAIDINQFMQEPKGEEKAYTYLTNLIYKKDAEGAQTKEYDTQNFVHEASYEGYCLQQEVPEHFQNHSQTHGSQERMIIPSDLVAAINGETVYYEWTDPDGTKRKATAEEFGREYENTIADNINMSIKQLRAELKLDSLNKKERNLALSEILQKEILDSSRYGIDMFLACGLDPETGDFRVPLGDPGQAKRIEQLLNSIIKSRVNKQEIAGGPIVQVTNWGTSKQLHIRFKDKQGNLLKTKEEWLRAFPSGSPEEYKQYIKENQAGLAYYEVYAPAWSKELFEKFRDKDGNIDIGAIEILNPDLLKMISYRIPTEEKYSIAPMKVVGFMPERAGSAIMFPYELTEIDDSDFDVDKRYVMRKVIEIGTRFEPKEGENATEAEKSYIQHNRKSLTKYLQKAVNLQGKTTAEERAAIEKDAKAAAEVDKRTAKRIHEEKLDAIAKRNAMIDEAEAKTEFSKDTEKSDEIYDKRVDKQEKWYDKQVAKEEKRYQLELDKIDARTEDTISEKITRLENKKAADKIRQFLDIDRWHNSSQDDALTRQLRIAYLRYMHPTYEPTSGKIANDNKIIDMSWGVLTHEAIATQLLNPGGFDNLKKIGYMIAAYKDPNNTKSWEELDKLSVSDLQDLHHSTKDLAWVDTQVDYYRQNVAAASLIGIFAVNKIAHAMLERDHLQIDTEFFFGKDSSFEIAGKKFEKMMEVDPSFDDEGKRIGKTIGSGVSGSADAAKTPALHLMNVNLSTVNIFTTLLRLGMTDKDAGLFCSQNIISEVLNEFNKKNLNNYEPMANIIEQRLIALRKEESLSEDSNINTEALTREELIEGLRNTNHPETDYKVLLAFQKIRSLADALRNPSFATRFNSISSAVGPQIIDNLILEHKMEQFGLDGEDTGFYDRDGNPVTINDIFEMHPVLGAFAEGVNIAKSLFREMPAGSTSFRNLLKKLPGSLADTIYNDKKLLSDLSNFYQSYLLIREGMIDESKLIDYIEKFPKEFMEKDKDGKSIQDKYPDNALIQNIKLISSKKTGRSFLTIKLTGEDEVTKDTYRTAWIDLHKKNPELSQRLFEYFFFHAGIGFSPKTGMALVPTFVKERLSKKTEDGREISYSEVYRRMPELKRVLKDQFDSELEEGKMIIDQFIRNNWNESKLVPKKGGEGTNYNIDLNEGRLVAFTESDVADLKGVAYMRTYQNGQTYLWRLIGEESDKENQKHRVYRRVKPLGDNNEYLEMSTKDIAKPYSETTLDIEDTETSDLASKSPAESSADQTVPVTSSDSQVTLTMELVEEAIAAQWESNNIVKSREEVKKRAQDIKGKEKQNSKFMVNALKKLNLNFTEEDFIREFKKLC